MPDIGFMELLLVGIVALVVLGPDKLPGAIRTSALWIGRAKRSFNKVKTEIEQQLNTDEIRRQLHNESILADIEKARKNADRLIKDTQKDIKESGDELQKTISSVADMPAITNSAEEGMPPEARDASTSISAEAPATTGTADTTQTTDTDSPGTNTPDTIEPATTGEQAAPVEQASPRTSVATEDFADQDKTPDVPPKAPVQDFYNSPPTGRVALKDGKFTAVEPDSHSDNDAETDTGNKA